MQRNLSKLIKETSRGTLLFLFLLAMLLPSISLAAESLGIILPFTGKPIIPNEKVLIKATTSDKKSGVTITFRADQPWVNISNGGKCITAGVEGTCSLEITPTQEGEFRLTLTAPNYNLVFTPEPIKVLSSQFLSISANPQSTKTGQDSKITVTTSDKKANIDIIFSGVNNAVLSPFSCKTNSSGSCTVTFNVKLPLGTASSTYPVVANATGYRETQLSITVMNPNILPPIIPTCTPPKVAFNGVCTAPTQTDYKLLAPLPCSGVDCKDGVFGTFNPEETNALGKYLNVMIKIFIGLAAVLAVIMIIIGGFEYMTSELAHTKEHGKERIWGAVLGLLIALGAYALLNTINPDILNTEVEIKQVNLVDLGGDTNEPIGNISVLPSGIICSGGLANIYNVAKSFGGKMTYELGAKGSPGPNNTIKLDCSGFVNYVLKCVNVPFINSGTGEIFANAEKVTSFSGTKVNGQELKPGDLIGWRAGDTSSKYGHVMVYIGNGQVADSHGRSSVGNALGIFSPSKYQGSIKFIKRAPGGGGGSGGGGGGGR